MNTGRGKPPGSLRMVLTARQTASASGGRRGHIASGPKPAGRRTGAQQLHASNLAAAPECADSGKDSTRLRYKDEEAAMENELLALAIACLATITVIVIIAIASLHTRPLD